MDLFLVKTWLKARLNVDSERGATMVEYVLILALIAILVIGVVAALGGTGEQQVQPGVERPRQLITNPACDSVPSRSERNGRRFTRRPLRVPGRTGYRARCFAIASLMRSARPCTPPGLPSIRSERSFSRPSGMRSPSRHLTTTVGVG